MKILIVIHREIFSGAEKVLFDSLEDSVYKSCVHLLIPQGGRLNNLAIERGINFSTSDNLKGISSIYKNHNLYGILKHVFLLNKEIITLMKEQNIDVIHANTIHSAARLLPLSIFYNTVWTLHDIGKSIRLNFLKFVLVLFFSKTIVVSNATLQSIPFNKFFKSRISIINNAIQVHSNIKRYKKRKLEFYSIGMIVSWKGQEKLLELWKVFFPNYKLNFIGGNDDTKYLEHFTKKLKNIKNINYLGYSSSPWKLIHSNTDAFFIHSSIEADPFPTVILESISNGIIPIISCYGGGSEILPSELHELLIFDPLDEISFKETVSEILLLNESDLNAVINKLQQFVKFNFTNEIKTKKLFKVYSDCL